MKKLDFSKWETEPDPQIWSDYLELRKRKKAPVTQTVINALGKLFKELPKLTLNEILEECVTRGWQGAKKDWFSDLVEIKAKDTRKAVINNPDMTGSLSWCDNTQRLMDKYLHTYKGSKTKAELEGEL